MCGIAGYVGRNEPGVAAKVKAMLRAQRHRGPDGAGLSVWTEPPFRPGPWHTSYASRAAELVHPDPQSGHFCCVLGHNWLAIQDRSDAARQPMLMDEDLALVLNGEIYNFVELREDLRKQGVAFSTQSDTEVLWHLWKRESVFCLRRLRGMFAFAACDRRDGRLWLARDPFGMKPLHYAPVYDGHGLFFASEVRSLHAAGCVPRQLDDGAVVASAAAGVNKFDDVHTLYKGVRELPPGYSARCRYGVFAQRYYDLPDPAGELSGDEATRELRRAVEESVRLHLRASRRIASCVSGGLDSTNLACLIGAEARKTGHEYDTFTIRTDVPGAAETGPDCREAGELAAAALVARQAGLRHHLVERREPIIPRDVIEMVVAYEVPNHVVGPINQFLLLRQVAAAGVTVVLDGQGGDELLSGYPWFPPVLLHAMRNRGREREAAELRRQLSQRLPLPAETAAEFERMFHDPAAWVAAFLWQGDFLGWSREKVLELPEAQYYLKGGGDWASFRRREYFQAELPYLLRQEDRLGMWFGLECRVPFVDAPLIDVASRLAPEWLLKDGYLKYPFRVMLPELPEQVRWDTRKRGFWEVDRSQFDWLPAAGKRLAAQSDQLNRLFPTMRDHWDALSFDQQWRLMQLAVLERAVTREDVDEVAREALP
jgi:asparagine synthase (glutamine-hydrolysing)